MLIVDARETALGRVKRIDTTFNLVQDGSLFYHKVRIVYECLDADSKVLVEKASVHLIKDQQLQKVPDFKALGQFIEAAIKSDFAAKISGEIVYG